MITNTQTRLKMQKTIAKQTTRRISFKQIQELSDEQIKGMIEQRIANKEHGHQGILQKMLPILMHLVNLDRLNFVFLSLVKETLYESLFKRIIAQEPKEVIINFMLKIRFQKPKESSQILSERHKKIADGLYEKIKAYTASECYAQPTKIPASLNMPPELRQSDEKVSASSLSPSPSSLESGRALELLLSSPTLQDWEFLFTLRNKGPDEAQKKYPKQNRKRTLEQVHEYIKKQVVDGPEGGCALMEDTYYARFFASQLNQSNSTSPAAVESSKKRQKVR
jgi:hypothetical protein